MCCFFVYLALLIKLLLFGVGFFEVLLGLLLLCGEGGFCLYGPEEVMALLPLCCDVFEGLLVGE